RRLSPDQRAALRVLSKNVVTDSRALARAVAAQINDTDRNLAANAMSILIGIEDLAAVPLLEVPEPLDPYDPLARINILIDSHLEIRNMIVTRLKKMLDDKRPMNYKQVHRVEEPPPPSRVCDEAYVLLRRLLNTSEAEDLQLENTRFFLELPEASKD